MTNAEAIKELSYIADEMPSMECADWKEAISMAIKALEQEPCEDAISRQAVLEIHSKYGEYMGATKFWEFRDSIRELPLVKPQKPKTGHWIAQDVHNCHTIFRCSECDYMHDFMHLYGEPTADYTFCPNCGAEMKEGEV